MRAVERARPHNGYQSVRRAVRQCDRFVFGLEAVERGDRAEDFFLARPTLRRKPFHYHGREEPPLLTPARRRNHFAATKESAAFLAREIEVTAHLRVMLFRDECALLGGRVERVADSERLGALHKLGSETVI